MWSCAIWSLTWFYLTYTSPWWNLINSSWHRGPGGQNNDLTEANSYTDQYHDQSPCADFSPSSLMQQINSSNPEQSAHVPFTPFILSDGAFGFTSHPDKSGRFSENHVSAEWITVGPMKETRPHLTHVSVLKYKNYWHDVILDMEKVLKMELELDPFLCFGAFLVRMSQGFHH